MTDQSQLRARPWERAWPVDGLEHVASCPICASQERKVLHHDLVDNVFFAAPGQWTLWRCDSCEAAYLDPRPDQRTIHLAYSNYYTHNVSVDKESYESLSPTRKFRRRLVNGYTNWQFCTSAQPKSVLGIFLMWLLPQQRRKLDSEYRYLPPHSRQEGKLLDVGCGSGAFLRTAQTCGWSVTGLEPDPQAVATARTYGLQVLHGGLDQMDNMANAFDVITIHHVIEHLHNPVQALKDCRRLLKPGGTLYVGTPNIDSLGHTMHGRNWRGLESPRHLVLFNPVSIGKALREAGFEEISHKRGPSPLLSMTKAFMAIRAGFHVDTNIKLTLLQKLHVLRGRIYQSIYPDSREFIAITCRKIL